jgi:N,N'-diacetyllegionaminate synthase
MDLTGRSTIIIAEAGVNHNGSLARAKKLIDAAAEAKVDYVKFQTFIAANLVSATAQKAEYQKATTGKDESQFDMIRKLELSREDHVALVEYCKSKGVNFLSTAFDLDSIDLLVELGVKIGKIPSGEITNYPYLVKMARSFETIIVSTGMSEISEISDAINILLNNGKKKKDITVLHCNTEYPTPFSDVNLNAMQEIAKIFSVKVGYSDHTLGIEVPIAAVALGATIIEKHFTLDKSLPGPDHQASLDPQELSAMVEGIRNIEKALGSSEKSVTSSEKKNLQVARKSIVAKLPISKGEIFTENNLTVKRPGSGISPMRWVEVLGKPAPRNFDPDEMIEL